MPKIGYSTCAYLTLHFAETTDVDEAAEKLKGVAEVVECHHVSGVTDLFVKVYAQSNSHLLSIIRQQLKPLGVVNVTSMISYREAFHRQMSFSPEQRIYRKKE
jgi:Lrp/AsnC family transcriptional regulator for asnA, asnC and gidA